MNQAVQKQVLSALLNLYMEVRSCDGFNPNLEGSENKAEEDALKALQAAGLLDVDGVQILNLRQHYAEIPRQDKVNEIRSKYPTGTRIRLDNMPFDPDPVPTGTYGTVEWVDDAGQLQTKWDNGRNLAVIHGVDEFTVLTISLDDFLASKKLVDDVEKALGFDNDTPNLKAYIYKDAFYIEKCDDGTLRLPLGRDEYVEVEDNLDKLEKILYDAHFGY